MNTNTNTMTFSSKSDCAAYIKADRLVAFPHPCNSLGMWDKWIAVIPYEGGMWTLTADGQSMVLLDEW